MSTNDSPQSQALSMNIPLPVAVTFETFAAIIHAAKCLEEVAMYIDDSELQSEAAFIAQTILENGSFAMNEIEIVSDKDKESEKSKSKALIPMTFFVTLSFGFRLIRNYVATSMPSLPAGRKGEILETLDKTLEEFRSAREESIKQKDVITEAMQKLANSIEEETGQKIDLTVKRSVN